MDIGTLTRFLVEQQRRFPGVSGRFTALLEEIATAAKLIGREVNKAGLAEMMGLTGAPMCMASRCRPSTNSPTGP